MAGGARAAGAAASPGRAGDHTPSATILVAGDIATCTGNGDRATARLVRRQDGIVMTAGDNVYPTGTLEQFQACYDPTWGRFRGRTRPAPGNHDWATPGAAGYFAYFGDQAGRTGRGYYRFRAGAWSVYVLDTMGCFLGGERSSCGRGSAQWMWLSRKLRNGPTACVLAVGHHPRFSSGPHGSTTRVWPLLGLLYRHGAEIVVNGHDHIYERFAPARPDGTPDALTGIRQFVVRTGGGGRYALAPVPAPNSAFRSNDSYGVLRLELAEDRYAWAFLRTEGSIGDSGTGACHGSPVTPALAPPGHQAGAPRRS